MFRYFIPPAAIIALLFALIWLIVYAIKEDAKAQAAWEVFKRDHVCKLVEHRDGTSHTNTGFALSGKGELIPVFTTTSTPAQEAWACNDGVTYWRDAR